MCGVRRVLCGCLPRLLLLLLLGAALCWPGCCRSDGDCWHAGMSLMMHGMCVSNVMGPLQSCTG
jgi:hypothetical protein